MHTFWRFIVLLWYSIKSFVVAFSRERVTALIWLLLWKCSLHHSADGLLWIEKRLWYDSGHLDFLVAHGHLHCHDTETSLCGKFTHLNSQVVFMILCMYYYSFCRTRFDRFHVAIFVMEYVEIVSLEFDTGFWHAILRDITCSLKYDFKR